MNGRFEEYFEARPLTPQELRMPETAKQIAKRMRELHDGIELLEEEREGGPMIFKNWDKWVDRCEQVTTWLDKEIQSPHNEAKAASEPWRRRGFVCGVTWDKFRKAVDNYRLWLVAGSGGIAEIKRQLVFAHNDVSVSLLNIVKLGIDVSRLNMATSYAWSRPHSHRCSCLPMSISSSSSSISNTPLPIPLAWSSPTTL